METVEEIISIVEDNLDVKFSVESVLIKNQKKTVAITNQEIKEDFLKKIKPTIKVIENQILTNPRVSATEKELYIVIGIIYLYSLILELDSKLYSEYLSLFEYFIEDPSDRKLYALIYMIYILYKQLSNYISDTDYPEIYYLKDFPKVRIRVIEELIDELSNERWNKNSLLRIVKEILKQEILA
jgi:hypothetical protein